ncbi:MAG: response regulator transcription factor [Ignavibacteriales bacterium]|nr:response regulator transcription factor [Ignavibacteriales bacterium]
MKVLIADDHTIVREGLKQIVMSMDEKYSVEEAGDGHETLTKIEKNRYDLIILDISMPGLSGLDILKMMKDRKEKAHILILSMHPQEQYAIRALRLGASGYLCKNSIYEELTLAVKKIAAGGKYISAALAEKIIFEKEDELNKLPHEKLSEREFQIMYMIANGRSLKEIACELFISDKTVSTYRMRILEKMGLNKNAELTQYAIRNNLIE